MATGRRAGGGAGDRLVDVEAGEVLEGRGLLVRGERIEGLLDPGQPPPEGAEVARPARAHAAAGADRLPHPPGGRAPGVRDPGDRPQRRPGGAERGRQRAGHGDGRVHDACATSAPSGRSWTWPCATRSATAPWSGRGWRWPARTSPFPGAAGPSPAWPPTSSCPATSASGRSTSPAEVRQRVRAILYGGADFIKVIATGAVLALGTRPGAPELSEDELAAAVTEAAAQGTHVAAHAHGTAGHPQRRPGRRPLHRARLAAGRRGGRPAGRAGHLPGRRHLQRRLHRRRGGAGRAGRPRRWPRTRPPPRPSATASPRRSRPGCGSPTAPTAASTRTAGTPGSCPTWPATG